MDIYNAIVRILAEVMALSSGMFDRWVYLPVNAQGPLDVNAGLTASGTDLAGYLASAAVGASDIMCVVVDTLF